MKLRAAKKHLRKGKITPQTRMAIRRFLRHVAIRAKTFGHRHFARHLHEQISQNYVDIKDINLIGIINISHKNWHLAKVGNYPWEPEVPYIPAAITRMSFKISLPGKIHKIKIDAKFSL